jgi:hypothetical protein
MSKKLSEQIQELEKVDFDNPSIEELSRNSHPMIWKTSTYLMWTLFFVFIAASIISKYQNTAYARDILSNHKEVFAKVIETDQVLEDGKYTDYYVDLELTVDGEEQLLHLDIPEKIYLSNYKGKDEIPLIYVNADEYNIKSYYEGRSHMFTNWLSLLLGYLAVFVILYFVRHYTLTLLCRTKDQ